MSKKKHPPLSPFVGLYEQLDRIENTLERMEQQMSTQEEELNEAIAEQNEKLDNLVRDVTRLVDALENTPVAVDLRDEIAAVRASTEKIVAASDEADAEVPETP